MKNKPVLIMESNLNGLLLNEGASELKRDKYILSGIFTEFDIKNRNERIYTKDRFLPHLYEMQGRIKSLGVVYGEFDHPDVFDTSLTRVSHLIHSISYNESQNRVDGAIRLLNTPNGKTAKELVLDGCPLFVSSRAAGVTESDGTVSVKKLFTYDAVADPGFASAKMSLNVINESLGFNESTNLRIIDMSDESKINELFDMNKNDEKTQVQLADYAKYLEGEIPKIKEEILNNIKEGNDSQKFEQLSEYYEILQESYVKMTKYLDYLADNVQILVNENQQLKSQSEDIIKHNDYLAEKIEKTINYSEYIAENLSNSIDFSEYIAENVDKTIKYSEYLAEQVDKTIDYSEYIAEHTEFNLNNYEMLSEYVDNSVKYAEYVAEHVDNNIAYSEYIAENLSDTQAYSKYIAESLDKTIDGINIEKLNEDIGDDQRISDLKIDNVDKYYEDGDDNEFPPMDEELPDELSDIEEEEEEEEEEEFDNDDSVEVVQPSDDEEQVELSQTEEGGLTAGKEVTIDADGQEIEAEIISTPTDDGLTIVKVNKTEPQSQVQPQVQPQSQVQVQPQAQVDGQPVGDGQFKIEGQPVGQEQGQVQPQSQVQVQPQMQVQESEKSIKDTITELILETKKRKASEENEPHFLLFLTENNKAAWKKLSAEDKEKTVVALNESNYITEKDVLNIIRESLATKKSEEEILIDSIPEDLIDVWNNLNDTVKKSVLAQSKFYPNLVGSELKMESFWNSRELQKYTNTGKMVLNENQKYINDLKLTENQVDRYLSIFKNL